MIDKPLNIRRALQGKRKGGVLEQWRVEEYSPENGTDFKIAFGNIYGDSRFRDGARMHTSPVVEVHTEEKILETLNTYYVLGEKLKITQVE